MFAGITGLALVSDVRIAADPRLLTGTPAGYEQKTVITQLAAAVSGAGSPLFYLVAGFTAAILVPAANTAYNGFPILASILGEDGYLPKQFSRRVDRRHRAAGRLHDDEDHSRPLRAGGRRTGTVRGRHSAAEPRPRRGARVEPSHARAARHRLRARDQAVDAHHGDRPDGRPPHRDITGPVLAYVGRIRRRSPRDVVCVFIPEYVVSHWWEQFLHNQSALRLTARLLFRPGVMVTSVPSRLGSDKRRVRRRGRPG